MEKKSDRRAAIEDLAYSLWEQRGKPAGSHEADWLDAERMLREQQSAPNILACGIHEFTTGKHYTSGWTYFVLPSSAIADFAERAAQLLPAGQKEFRPRDFKDSEAAAFENFLRLIRDSIDHHESAVLEAVSKGSDWARDLYESSMRIVARGFGDAGVTDQKIVAIAQRCGPPLFTIQRALQNFGSNDELQLEISVNSTAAPFAALQMLMHLHSVAIAPILAQAFDAHASKLFPHSPRLNPDGSGIAILASARSFLVQASDVVGNFAAAVTEIGANSHGPGRKAEIFEAVFGDVRNKDGGVDFQYPAPS
jgi:hypothetical protein